MLGKVALKPDAGVRQANPSGEEHAHGTVLLGCLDELADRAGVGLVVQHVGKRQTFDRHVGHDRRELSLKLDPGRSTGVAEGDRLWRVHVSPPSGVRSADRTWTSRSST